jgi:hypothetical protein
LYTGEPPLASVDSRIQVLGCIYKPHINVLQHANCALHYVFPADHNSPSALLSMTADQQPFLCLFTTTSIQHGGAPYYHAMQVHTHAHHIACVAVLTSSVAWQQPGHLSGGARAAACVFAVLAGSQVA